MSKLSKLTIPELIEYKEQHELSGKALKTEVYMWSEEYRRIKQELIDRDQKLDLMEQMLEQTRVSSYSHEFEYNNNLH